MVYLDCSDTHIHNIEAKRCKVNNDSATYLWHCRLGHTGVKCMKKLHADGLLESLDYESVDACEPCLMGKMTKTPFSGTMERVTDLLEIIHNDVCVPMNIEAHGGCRCQNRRISGRGSRTVRLGRMVTGGKGHEVLPRFGPS